MILLEFQNRIITNLLSERLQQVDEEKVRGACTGFPTMRLLRKARGCAAQPVRPRCAQIDAIEVTIADFDGAMYHVSNPGGDKSKIQVSLGIKFYHELVPHGVNEVSNGTPHA
jgi:hypothetical protein